MLQKRWFIFYKNVFLHCCQ